MGIEEKNEWVLDLIIEEFSNLSGMFGGVDSDVVVYSKNSAKLLSQVSCRLHLKARPVRALMTIGDFAHHFIGLLDDKERQRYNFSLKIQDTIQKITGKRYELDEPVFSDLEPRSQDAAQNLREEMYRAVKLGNLKNKLIGIYGYYSSEEAMYRAKTIKDFTNLFFWPEYVAG